MLLIVSHRTVPRLHWDIARDPIRPAVQRQRDEHGQRAILLFRRGASSEEQAARYSRLRTRHIRIDRTAQATDASRIVSRKGIKVRPVHTMRAKAAIPALPHP